MSSEPVHAEWVISCEPTPFALIPEQLIYDTETQHASKMLWCALMRHANKRGEAWPSLRTLARLLGVNRTTVMRWRDHLEANGWLKAAHDLDADNNPTSRVRVWLFWTKVDPVTLEPVHERTGGSHPRNTPVAPAQQGVAPAQRHLIESHDREPEIERTPDARDARELQIERVYAHWLSAASSAGIVSDVTRSRLTPGRREKIERRLREGYSVDELCDAVSAALASEFHRQKPAYCELASVLGSREKVDRHLANANGRSVAVDDQLAKAQQLLDRSQMMHEWMSNGA
jgi:hypothetical protein